MRTAIGGGPMLIHESVIRITCLEEQFICGDELRPRTAIGYTRDHRLIILVVAGDMFPNNAGVTLEEEARIMLDLGCDAAINLNTDATTSLQVNGKNILSGSLLQRSVFAITAK